MREPIINERVADNRDIPIKPTTPERERSVDAKRYANSYVYEGYKVRETFDPNGPSLSDCIVRVFTG